jgi:hypothetical protein
MSNLSGPKRVSREFGKSNQQPVQVLVRVRPSDQKHCVETTADSVYISNPRNSLERIQYTFNRVFGPDCLQVFLVKKVGCIFIR